MSASRLLQQKLIDELLNTVWAISSSRWCRGFLVGYTAQTRRKRFAGYKTNEWHHMVILENGLTQAQALNLEQRLQTICKKGKACGPPYRRKYAPEHRELRYYESAGPGSPAPLEAIHSVYMVWWE